MLRFLICCLTCVLAEVFDVIERSSTWIHDISVTDGICDCASIEAGRKLDKFCECKDFDELELGHGLQESDYITFAETTCLHPNLPRFIFATCQSSCNDNCLHLLSDAKACWGVPTSKVNKHLDHCIFTPEQYDVLPDRPSQNTPHLPYTVGPKGRPSMSRCSNNPANIHIIHWGFLPNANVQYIRKSAEVCGFKYHYILGDLKKTFSKTRGWEILKEIDALVESLADRDPCDMIIFQDEFDALIQPNCVELKDRFLSMDSELVFSAETESRFAPVADVWNRLQKIEFDASKDEVMYGSGGMVIGRSWSMRALMQWSVRAFESGLGFANLITQRIVMGESRWTFRYVFQKFYALCHIQNCSLNPTIDFDSNIFLDVSNHSLVSWQDLRHDGVWRWRRRSPVFIHGHQDIHNLTSKLYEVNQFPESYAQTWTRLTREFPCAGDAHFDYEDFRLPPASGLFTRVVYDCLSRQMRAVFNTTHLPNLMDQRLSRVGWNSIAIMMSDTCKDLVFRKAAHFRHHWTWAICSSMAANAYDFIAKYVYYKIKVYDVDQRLMAVASAWWQKICKNKGYEANEIIEYVLAWMRYMYWHPFHRQFFGWKFESDLFQELDDMYMILIVFRGGMMFTEIDGIFGNRVNKMILNTDTWQRSSRPKGHEVAITIASTPNSMQSIENMVFLWKCYAAKHGHHLDVDWRDPMKDRPKVIPEQMTGRFSYRHNHAPERYFAARRAMDRGYEWLFLIEPDQVIDPSCWNVGLHSLIAAEGKDAHIIITDFAPHQTINEGTMFIRNSPVGRLFLDIFIHFFDKLGYSNAGYSWGLGETLFALAAYEKGHWYLPACLEITGADVEGGMGMFAHYINCWHKYSKHDMGPFGNRTSKWVRYLDGRRFNLNERVHIGFHRRNFLYHAANMVVDKYHQLYSIFGMTPTGRRDESCARVYDHVKGYNETTVYDVRWGYHVGVGTVGGVKRRDVFFVICNVLSRFSFGLRFVNLEQANSASGRTLGPG